MSPTATAAAPPPPLLSVSALSKSYAEQTVVDDVTFTVDPGEVVVLVGPNGSGKTTTMECAVGLRRPSCGRVRVLDHDPAGAWRGRRLVGVQLQESGLPSRLRVEEAFVACAALYRRPWPLGPLVERLGLAGHRRTFYERLSGGLKRRVNIGLALLGRPPLVVLDEPTSGVDPEGRAELWTFLAEVAAGGTGILLSTHDLGEAEDHADRVLAMHGGRLLLDGSVAALVARHGAEWRLRVSRPDAITLAALQATGVRVVTSVERALVLGSRARVLDLRDRLEADPAASFGGLVTGPVRLEDLYFHMREEQ